MGSNEYLDGLYGTGPPESYRDLYHSFEQRMDYEAGVAARPAETTSNFSPTSSVANVGGAGSGKAALIMLGIFLLGILWMYETVENFAANLHRPVDTSVAAYGNIAFPSPATAAHAALAAYASSDAIIDNLPLGSKVGSLKCGEVLETVDGINQDENSAFGGITWTKVYYPDRSTIAYVPSDEVVSSPPAGCQ